MCGLLPPRGYGWGGDLPIGEDFFQMREKEKFEKEAERQKDQGNVEDKSQV
ncbi:hypothetical protein ZEAMMB73_Zm00001d018434 [Zea mays]|uniref:Uncharacterized protein n=1 Tax=Zea mays TaxID=4577 RepID=A0A1D6HNW9_MAIZE|nr:hypothetical protein ZEAMMB73_Zm00001d018434 [Zea mays]